MKDDDPTPEEIRQARAELVAMGLIIDSGRKRRGQTVWVTREQAARMGLKLPPLKPLKASATRSTPDDFDA